MDKSFRRFLPYDFTCKLTPLACRSLAGYGSLARTTRRKMPLKPFVLQAFLRGAAAD